MGSLADCVRSGKTVKIVNMANGDDIVQFVLSPNADESMNEVFIEKVCDVAEKYIGYLNKNECNVSIHYKNFTAVGICDSDNYVKTIRIKSTGEVLAMVKYYSTVDIFNFSLFYGVAYAVENYYTAIKKKMEKSKKEALKKRRSR